MGKKDTALMIYTFILSTCSLTRRINKNYWNKTYFSLITSKMQDTRFFFEHWR